ncbi:hypothetical protein SAMN05421780_101490 [Flexibacter flexilis DSM 6793]|uniref:Uncharacterized protein n=1 Tax=Flexibacter flexilis DSM 6793 TaxID=927664 RepID=A0A1I1E1Q7_9BACT|nr:hypothetical protein SAMN05421780_101490 [Flexibacter flexilis DSM 6793]
MNGSSLKIVDLFSKNQRGKHISNLIFKCILIDIKKNLSKKTPNTLHCEYPQFILYIKQHTPG